MENKVFLGGTCADTNWRDWIIPGLKVNYFNPVVEDWTPECQDIEYDEKNLYCNIHLYVITKEMKGVFYIAEAVNSAHEKCTRTIFQVVPNGFTDGELRSLKATVDLINMIGGIAYIDSKLSRCMKIINNCFKDEQ